MTKLAKAIHYVRMFLFIINFYFIFAILHNILDMKIYGYIFLVIYIAYIIKVIIDLLSKKERYQYDIIYNLMQIGVISYIIFTASKICLNEMYVTNMTYSYFKTNFSIMSALILFIFIYNFVELHDKEK